MQGTDTLPTVPTVPTVQATDKLPPLPTFDLWRFPSTLPHAEVVQLSAPPTQQLQTWHFGFEGPWNLVSAPLQRLTLFFEVPLAKKRDAEGSLVPAPPNKTISQLLELICTDEMCESQPSWLERRTDVEGTAFLAFTDPDDDGVLCSSMPGELVTEKNMRALAHGVHRAERVRVELLRLVTLAPSEIDKVIAELRALATDEQTHMLVLRVRAGLVADKMTKTDFIQLTNRLWMHYTKQFGCHFAGSVKADFLGLTHKMWISFMNRHVCDAGCKFVKGPEGGEPTDQQWDTLTSLCMAFM